MKIEDINLGKEFGKDSYLNYVAEKYKEDNKRFKQDTNHRKTLLWWVIVTVSIYLLIVMFFVSTQVIDYSCFKSKLTSPLEIVALLTTTSLNVLGLAYIILKGLFPKAP